MEQRELADVESKLLSKSQVGHLWAELYDESMPFAYAEMIEAIFAHVKALSNMLETQ